MAKYQMLKPRDWVIFREYSHKTFGGRDGHKFVWRIGRVVSVPDKEFVHVTLCAPQPPREVKKFDAEKEPWNVPWLTLSLSELPSDYLVCVHLRDRGKIPWVSESQIHKVKQSDVVPANAIADVEAFLASPENWH